MLILLSLISLLIIMMVCTSVWLDESERTQIRAAQNEVAFTTQPLQFVEPTVIVRSLTKPNFNIPLSEEEKSFVYEIGSRCNVPSALIFAIMETESDFNKAAVSITNDWGIMQIHKPYFNTYIEFTPDAPELYDLDLNILDFKSNVIAGVNALIYWHRQVPEDYPGSQWTGAMNAYNLGFPAFEPPYNQVYSKKLYKTMEMRGDYNE